MKYWHDELDGDAIAAAVGDDPMLDDAWRAEAMAIVERLAGWVSIP